VLARYLIIIIVLNLSLTAALDLLGDYSIILLKSNTAGFSVVIYSLEVSLGSLKDLIVSRSITCYGNGIVMLAKGAVNQLVEDIAGLAEVCFYLLRVSTRTTPERA
jgi:hypothetical protein